MSQQQLWGPLSSYRPSSLIFCSSSAVSAAMLEPPCSRAWNSAGLNTGLQLRTNNWANNLPYFFHQLTKKYTACKYLVCHLVAGSKSVPHELWRRNNIIHINFVCFMEIPEEYFHVVYYFTSGTFFKLWHPISSSTHLASTHERIQSSNL